MAQRFGRQVDGVGFALVHLHRITGQGLPQAQPARVPRAVQQRVPARLVFAVRGRLQEFSPPPLAVALRVSE